MDAATTTHPTTTPTNGQPDPFAGLDPDVAAVARATQHLVDEHTRHQAAIDHVLEGIPEGLRGQVETFHDRRYPTRRRPVGRPAGAKATS